MTVKKIQPIFYSEIFLNHYEIVNRKEQKQGKSEEKYIGMISVQFFSSSNFWNFWKFRNKF